MRISTNYQYTTYQYDLQIADGKLANVSQELSSGKRINEPSDDPVGLGQAMSMQSLQDGITQYLSNLNTANGALGTVDSTLSAMSTQMNQAYSLAVQGASSTMDQNSLNALVSQITQIQSQIVNLANAQGPTGAYLFAGQKTDAKPYTVQNGNLVFNGDTNLINAEIGPGQTLQTNVVGEPMISTMYNNLEALKNDLSGGNIGAISDIDITNIQSSQAAISTTRGQVGAKMQTVSSLTSQYQIQSDNLTKSISSLTDVDMASAAVQYQEASQAYSAALTVVGQGSTLSLLDFIK
ncbi:MAG TPA: flagellar hook-associated protein FlgL [Fimbriimonadaceae bacterium]|nr:flagellar hook-associated protein FlgL [Fimbriimonadaceae bacterium]